mgnify:CR=1 FL=1
MTLPDMIKKAKALWNMTGDKTKVVVVIAVVVVLLLI